jgi:tryptophan synthase alpha chain
MAKFIGYLPAHYPDYFTSMAAFRTLIDCGADVIEVGIPYSDPVMDGITIQAAAKKAISSGFHVDSIFRTVSQIKQYSADAVANGRRMHEVEVYVMSYYNLVYKFGQEKFAEYLQNAGANGTIIPDLTPDSAQEWMAISQNHNLNTVFLTALNSTPERLQLIAEHSTGFIYASALLGTTGVRQSGIDVSSARESVEHIRIALQRAQRTTPIYLGLGVSNEVQAQELATVADGVIVGSKLVEALGTSLTSLQITAGSIGQAIHSVSI